jgi:hypothetical protein
LPVPCPWKVYGSILSVQRKVCGSIASVQSNCHGRSMVQNLIVELFNLLKNLAQIKNNFSKV